MSNFGNYHDAKTEIKKTCSDIPKAFLLACGSSDEFYSEYEKVIFKKCLSEDDAFKTKIHLESEKIWWQEKRPYFNVWPQILKPLQEFRIQHVPVIDFSNPPIPVFEARFPVGYFKHFDSALVSVFSTSLRVIVSVFVWSSKDNGYSPLIMVVNKESLEKKICDTDFGKGYKDGFVCECCGEKQPELLMSIYNTCLSILLMQEDPDAIEFDVLSKDRERYEIATELEKKRLEKKSINRRGRIGFHVGRKCETSPHWRNPHLALFWTGKGRAKPKIKLRAGCVVKQQRFKKVPTGYHDLKKES